MEAAVVDRAYAGLEPFELWRHFSALNRIPRPSGLEESATRYVRDVAGAAGASWQSDEAGNTVVRVAPVECDADAPVVAVQAHLDMVCDSDPGVTYESRTDPIVPRRDGDAIVATGTTLGADNGVGAAAALALLTTPGVTHGPLELLFTVEEEIGLRGALAFDSALLRARLLLNLDGEDHRTLLVGSSGTQDISVGLPVAGVPAPARDARAVEVVVAGLRGGHSGMAIREHHANALKLLAEVVRGLLTAGVDVALSSISGGTGRNAIPRSARATLALPAHAMGELDRVAGELSDGIVARWAASEPDLTIAAAEVDAPTTSLAPESANAVLELLEQLPHGVLALADPPAPNVRTSCNLALADVSPASATLLVTSRSHVAADQEDVHRSIDALAAGLGGAATITSSYPPWSTAAAPEQGLVALAADTWADLHGRRPSLEAVDGGLECGVIAAKVPGMQAVSFGPLITGAHTTRERVDASTVPGFWRMLLALLQAAARGGDEKQPGS